MTIGALSNSNASCVSQALTRDIAAGHYDTLDVPYYDQPELNSVMNFYRAHGLLWGEQVYSRTTSDTREDPLKPTSPNLIFKILKLTGGNAKKLATSATSFLY